MVAAKKSTAAKPAPKKTAAVAKAAPAHPTWVDMIKVCIILACTSLITLLSSSL